MATLVLKSAKGCGTEKYKKYWNLLVEGVPSRGNRTPSWDSGTKEYKKYWNLLVESEPSRGNRALLWNSGTEEYKKY